MPTKTLGAVALSIILLGAFFARAAEEPEPSSNGLLAAMDRSHDAVSRQIVELSEKIDWFLGGVTVCDDSRGSSVHAKGSVVFHKDGEVAFDHKLRVKLVLPNTREKIRFLFESEPESAFEEPLRPGSRSPTETGTLSERTDLDRLSAALQFVLRERRHWFVGLEGGARVRIPPDPYARLRLKRSLTLGNWRLRGAQTFFWFDSIGAGETTQIDLDRRLANCMLFRSASEVTWKERRRVFELGQNFGLFQELSPRAILAYKAGVTGETDPNTHLSSWGVGVEYRRMLHQEWLFLAVEPAVGFRKANDFEAEPSIRLSLEVTFGRH